MAQDTLDLTPLLRMREITKTARMQMRNWIFYILLAVATAFLLHSTARADDSLKLDIESLKLDVPCAADIPEPRRAHLDYNKIPGFWFQYDVALCMLDRLELFPKLVERVGLFEQRLELSNELIDKHREITALSNHARDKAESALNKAIKGRREAEEKLNHWTRSPLLWVGVGVGATVIVIVGGAFFVNAVN